MSSIGLKRKRSEQTNPRANKRRDAGPARLPDELVAGVSNDGAILQASQESSGSNTYYQARQILEETRTKYLIEWENNIVTGESYQPTWVSTRCLLRSTISSIQLYLPMSCLSCNPSYLEYRT